MSLSVKPLKGHFAGEISGVDHREPFSEAEVQAIEAGVDRHAISDGWKRSTTCTARRYKVMVQR